MRTPLAPKRAANSSGRLKEDRLARQDWLQTGLRVLGQTGPGGLRIDAVCAAMNVTKGSFYWHFRDRQDFLGHLFQFWRDRETTSLIAHVEARHRRPRDRVWNVVSLVMMGDYDAATEITMRQWAQYDPVIREALAQVDAERLAFFDRQFIAEGFPPDGAQMRAMAVYALLLSSSYLLVAEERPEREARLRASLDLMFASPKPL